MGDSTHFALPRKITLAHQQSGGTKVTHGHFLERMGSSCDACGMASMVRHNHKASPFIEIPPLRSMILYLACIMSFVWRTGTTEDANIVPLTPSEARMPRALITFVLALGVIYFFLIATTFRRYGDNMDRAWQQRIIGWTQEKLGRMHGSKSSFRPETFSTPRLARSPRGEKSLRGTSTPQADRTTSSESTNSKPLSRPSSVQMATFTSLPQHSPRLSKDVQALPLEDLSTSSTANVPLSYPSTFQGGNILTGNSLQPPIATPQNDAPRYSFNSIPAAPNPQRSASFDELPPISARRNTISKMNTKSGVRSGFSSLDKNSSLPSLNEDRTSRKIQAPPHQIELVKVIVVMCCAI